MLEWTKIDAGPDSEHYVNKEQDNEQECYLIQKHENDNFGVVWLKYPDAFMNFCETAEKAQKFCTAHKICCVGPSKFCREFKY